MQAFILKGKECRVLSAAGFIEQKVWNQFCVTLNPVWQVSGQSELPSVSIFSTDQVDLDMFMFLFNAEDN